MNTKRRAMGLVLGTLMLGLLLPNDARAAPFLGLDAGTYDVELTCGFVNCGGPFTGVLTTDGSDITDWRFSTDFDAFPLLFSGDPTEFDGGPISDFQKAFGPDTSNVGFTLVLFGGLFVGDWSIETNGLALWSGTWVATPHQESAPEPASLLLLGMSAAGLAANERRRRNR